MKLITKHLHNKANQLRKSVSGINLFKGRSINYTKKVKVYRNLHKDCWSATQNGRVIFHADNLVLKDCKMTVRPAGHAKFQETHTKNVHAFIEGYLGATKTEYLNTKKLSRITYTPSHQPYFYKVSNGERVDSSDYVIFEGKEVRCV